MNLSTMCLHDPFRRCKTDSASLSFIVSADEGFKYLFLVFFRNPRPIILNPESPPGFEPAAPQPDTNRIDVTPIFIKKG